MRFQCIVLVLFLSRSSLALYFDPGCPGMISSKPCEAVVRLAAGQSHTWGFNLKSNFVRKRSTFMLRSNNRWEQITLRWNIIKIHFFINVHWAAAGGLDSRCFINILTFSIEILIKRVSEGSSVNSLSQVFNFSARHRVKWKHCMFLMAQKNGTITGRGFVVTFSSAVFERTWMLNKKGDSFFIYYNSDFKSHLCRQSSTWSIDEVRKSWTLSFKLRFAKLRTNHIGFNHCLLFLTFNLVKKSIQGQRFEDRRQS